MPPSRDLPTVYPGGGSCELMSTVYVDGDSFPRPAKASRTPVRSICNPPNSMTIVAYLLLFCDGLSIRHNALGGQAGKGLDGAQMGAHFVTGSWRATQAAICARVSKLSLF